MTTRQTITHADEIYRGNAYKAGYSPDGRRGTLMSNLHWHEFLSTAGVPAVAADKDGFYASNGAASDLAGDGTNYVSLCTGALCSSKPGSTVLTMDVPRNIVFVVCAAETPTLKIHGRDVYDEPMAESITASGGGGNGTSGKRCFKNIDKLYSTAGFTSTIYIGTGNRLGVPFHLQHKGQVVSVSADGKTNTSGATGSYTINIGASSATTIDTTVGGADVRGNILFVSDAPDGSVRFGALLSVDASTNRKAFGPPQVSSCTNGVA